jgi:hypothetical protein
MSLISRRAGMVEYRDVEIHVNTGPQGKQHQPDDFPPKI